jgi:hypothetical protein
MAGPVSVRLFPIPISIPPVLVSSSYQLFVLASASLNTVAGAVVVHDEDG